MIDIQPYKMCNIYIYITHILYCYIDTTLYYVARIYRCIPYGHHLMQYIRIHNITNVYIYIYIMYTYNQLQLYVSLHIYIYILNTFYFYIFLQVPPQ